MQRRAALVPLPRNPKQPASFLSNLPSLPHFHRSLQLPFHSAPLPLVTTATGEEGVGRTRGGERRGGKTQADEERGDGMSQVNLGAASLWCGDEEQICCTG